ncbi:hypothetical protein M0804_013722 [Polistes exclamans]|nr:hypothetical protein M0804_013722 [Polistes exclamans]
MYNQNDSIDSYISKASVLMLEKFHPKNASIYSWLNKFESVADNIGIPNHRMGEFLYSMLESPENLNITKDDRTGLPFNHSYQEVKFAFLTHYGLLDKIKLARDRFKYRVQYEHETIEKYAASLQKLHAECSYVDECNRKLTKQFLRGLCHQDIGICLENIRDNWLHFNEAVIKAVELQKLWRNTGLNVLKADKQETSNAG